MSEQSYLRFRNALLDKLSDFNESDAYCDLEVHCRDGTVLVQHLVLAALCPALLPADVDSWLEICIKVPDLEAFKLLTFLRCLYNGKLRDVDPTIVNILEEVSSIFGTNFSKVNNQSRVVHFSKFLTSFSDDNKDAKGFKKVIKNKKKEYIVANTESAKHDSFPKDFDILSPLKVGLNNIEFVGLEKTFKKSKKLVTKIEENIPLTFVQEAHSSAYSTADEGITISDDFTNNLFLDNAEKSLDAVLVAKNQHCFVNLSKLDLDNVTDEVLSANFSDQEGRLVCLICYKIMGNGEFQLFRKHLQAHDEKQRDKITVTIEFGPGGPGFKKKFTTDEQLIMLYADKNKKYLICSKCGKRAKISEKLSFRKHLSYHNLKEKKYFYACDICKHIFADPSNLRRHMQSIHEKQIFRCLHCDFENTRKKRLEDHLLTAHPDKAGGDEEMSLDKGVGEIQIADLNSGDTQLESNHQVEGSITDFGSVSAENRNNLLISQDCSTSKPISRFIYQCTGCKFRKRQLVAVESHIKECHSDRPGLPIKKIALRVKEPGVEKFTCDQCEKVFRKRTLMNQHRFKVHNIELDTEYSCGECGIKCATLPGLKAHQRGHQEKKFLCGSCSKAFLVLSQLKEHVTKGVCQLENRQCKICGKIYSDKIRLDLHTRIHTNEKPFRCTQCSKAFSQKRSLKEHLLTHDSARHFKCDHCEKKFVQKNHLKYHMASQHSDTENIENKNQCNICGKLFAFPYQLRRHGSVHGSGGGKGAQAKLQCGVCGHWFSSPAFLKIHLETTDHGKQLQQKNMNVPPEQDLVEPSSSVVVMEPGQDKPADTEELEGLHNINWEHGEIVIESDSLSELGGDGEDGFELAMEPIPGTNQFKLVRVMANNMALQTVEEGFHYQAPTSSNWSE